MNKLFLKVCGITQVEQAVELIKMPINFLGFIFYPNSSRYVKDFEWISKIDFQNKVGVFVDEKIDLVETIAQKCNLNILQLHGSESVEYCEILKQKKYKIIKAIPAINHNINLQKSLDKYQNCVDYFLLDTPSKQHGGSGSKFDWEILFDMNFKKPFFLSGGISNEDVANILALKKKHNNLFSIDVNSRFETSPGIKDLILLHTFINNIRHQKF